MHVLGEYCMRFLVFFLVPLLSTLRLTACTGILMQAEDQSTVNGRTVEFGIELDMSLAIIPRNFSFVAKTPMGKGMAYKSKYAVAGIYCFEDPVLMDGINEKGLSAAAFYYARYDILSIFKLDITMKDLLNCVKCVSEFTCEGRILVLLNFQVIV